MPTAGLLAPSFGTETDLIALQPTRAPAAPSASSLRGVGACRDAKGGAETPTPSSQLLSFPTGPSDSDSLPSSPGFSAHSRRLQQQDGGQAGEQRQAQLTALPCFPAGRLPLPLHTFPRSPPNPANLRAPEHQRLRPAPASPRALPHEGSLGSNTRGVQDPRS